MKSLYYYFLLTLVLFGCSNNDIFETTPNTSDSNLHTITISMPNNNSRVAYFDSQMPSEGTGTPYKWQENDSIAIASLNSENKVAGVSKFKLISHNEDFSNATFQGNIDVEGEKYVACYPYDYALTDYSLLNQSVDLTNPDNITNNNVILLSDYVSSIDEPIKLQPMNSILKLNLKNIPSDIGSIKRIEWSVKNGSELTTTSVSVKGISQSANNLSLCISFLPSQYIFLPYGEFIVSVIGDKKYQVVKTLNDGMDFLASVRYIADIDAGYKEFTYFDSKIATLLKESNDGFVLTSDNDIDPKDPTNAAIIKGINTINFDNKDISSIKGLEYFDLTELSLYTNPSLTELDLSCFPNLKTLFASSCSLTTINIKGCKYISKLYIDFNQLTSLDLTDCIANMGKLQCTENKIATLDVTGATSSLSKLYCYNQHLNGEKCKLILNQEQYEKGLGKDKTVVPYVNGEAKAWN